MSAPTPQPGILDIKPYVAGASSASSTPGTHVSRLASNESPLGPILIDFGFPILKEGFDKTEVLRFSFGARF